jgi:hypothetical protein
MLTFNKLISLHHLFIIEVLEVDALKEDVLLDILCITLSTTQTRSHVAMSKHTKKDQNAYRFDGSFCSKPESSAFATSDSRAGNLISSTRISSNKVSWSLE